MGAAQSRAKASQNAIESNSNSTRCEIKDESDRVWKHKTFHPNEKPTRPRQTNAKKKQPPEHRKGPEIENVRWRKRCGQSARRDMQNLASPPRRRKMFNTHKVCLCLKRPFYFHAYWLIRICSRRRHHVSSPNKFAKLVHH